jgi:hypothetical protein
MQSSTRRRWFQFSTLGLLALMVLVALLCAFVVAPARSQRDAVQRILDRGGYVTYDFEPQLGTPVSGPFYTPQPPGPVWLRAIVGDDYFQSVRSVYFSSLYKPDDVSDIVIAALAFPDLESLELSSHTIADEDLRAISTLTSLRRLSLQTNNGLDRAAPITAAGLAHLANLHELESLTIDGSFSDDALAALSGLSKLRSLHIEAPITDDGMIHLRRLEQLERLSIDSDHDLEGEMEMDCDDISFSDVLDYYCACLDIRRDPSCDAILELHGITENTNIDVHLNGPRRVVIDQTLEPHNLGFCITKRRFFLTSRSDAIAARQGITDLRRQLPNLTDVRVPW